MDTAKKHHLIFKIPEQQKKNNGHCRGKKSKEKHPMQMEVLTKEETGTLPVGTEILKTFRFLVTALRKRLRVMF